MLRMKKRVLETRKLTVLALLIALVVVFTRFLSFENQDLRISATFIPETLMGMLFGPFWTGIGSVIADTVGILLFPKTGAYFPGFTLNAFITGAIYGFFYYKKEITWPRVITATLLVTVIVHLILTPLWLGMLYNIDLKILAWWVPRIIKNLIFFPIQVAATYYMGTRISYKQLIERVTASYNK
ncbi:folate family ECF transporter S component [Enterococcus sp. LJL128]|uniref:folate family ECF transporter S component n=1 Tax=Enterococcus sp. LJL51 TaxID=3416656 RepID=UPI003CE9F8D5